MFRPVLIAVPLILAPLAWTTAAFHHRSVRRLVVLSAPHPLRVRAALLTDVRGQFTAALPALKFQIPRYEHALTRHDAAAVGDYLRRWGGPTWLGSTAYTEYERACRTAGERPRGGSGTRAEPAVVETARTARSRHTRRRRRSAKGRDHSCADRRIHRRHRYRRR